MKVRTNLVLVLFLLFYLFFSSPEPKAELMARMSPRISFTVWAVSFSWTFSVKFGMPNLQCSQGFAAVWRSWACSSFNHICQANVGGNISTFLHVPENKPGQSWAGASANKSQGGKGFIIHGFISVFDVWGKFLETQEHFHALFPCAAQLLMPGPPLVCWRKVQDQTSTPDLVKSIYCIYSIDSLIRLNIQPNFQQNQIFL